MAYGRSIFGFAGGIARERAASLFYSNRVVTSAVHMVDMRLDLAAAAGAAKGPPLFPLPPGRAEGELPDGDFVLASPLAGWRSKQWPIEHYRDLAARLRQLGIPLALNGPPAARADRCVASFGPMEYRTLGRTGREVCARTWCRRSRT